MRYIYMDNFRGFENTIIPLRKNTFLVGENSTGKSSFLKLLNVLSQYEFCFVPEYAFQEEDLGGFEDIVSVWSEDKSFFKIGVLNILDNNVDSKTHFDFTVRTLTEKNGVPFVSRYIQYENGELIKVKFSKSLIKYKVIKHKLDEDDEEHVLNYFQDIIDEDNIDNAGYKRFPKKYRKPPIGITIAIIRSIERGKSHNEINFEITNSSLSLENLAGIAPIRTKPQRIYNGLKKGFSPEGDHTPWLLRNQLKTKSSSTEFVEKLRDFGDSSGLFETVTVHSYSKKPQAPFELIIQFAGAKLNINNVGYGVSQVLPLVVEFLTRKSTTFAIQQPEVHLHPRAQSALGAFTYELSKDRDHSFIIETHSDYLIDRFRLSMSKDSEPQEAQIIFFERVENGNKAHVIPIDSKGRYAVEQPDSFRDFFINEAISLLDI